MGSHVVPASDQSDYFSIVALLPSLSSNASGPVPRAEVERWRKEHSLFLSDHDRPPTTEEMAEIMGLSDCALDALVKALDYVEANSELGRIFVLTAQFCLLQ